MVNLTERVDRLEIMDTERLPQPVMKETLRFLQITNRYFGGSRVILKSLERSIEVHPLSQPLTLLDVGTGAADIPIRVAEWARRRHIKIYITAVDLVPEIVALAKSNAKEFPEIKIIQKDVKELIREKQSFDFVTASLFLHHMPDQNLIRILKGLDQLTKRGLILSDLTRSQLGYWSVKLLAQLMGNSVVRNDGPLSVQRGFRPHELEKIVHQAGIPYLKVRREPWFRISLSGEKN